MKELVLHIGQGKCASSSLQAFLSQNPVIEGSDSRLDYRCLLPGQVCLRGHAVTEVADKSPARFLSSVVDQADPSEFFAALEEFKREGTNETVIISNEGLANNWLNSERAANLEALGVPIRIFMLCRPPGDWLNASWWQWGCFADVTVAEWVQRVGPGLNFFQRLKPWRSIINVTSVHVGDISQDPISQFQRFLGVPAGQHSRDWNFNAASSADLLRFLINNKTALNRSVHNPNVEFELNRIIAPSGGPPPFVLTPPMVKEVIERTRDDHTELLKEMNWEGAPSSAVLARYLDPAAYEHDYTDFDLETFLRQEPSRTFLSQVNLWLLDRLHSIATAGAGFDATRYLELNPDVAAAGANAYEHYVRHGMAEGRKV